MNKDKKLITECLTTLVTYAVINEKTKDQLLAQFKENAGPEKTYKKNFTLKSSVRKAQKEANKDLEAGLEAKRQLIKESEESQSVPEEPVSAPPESAPTP